MSSALRCLDRRVASLLAMTFRPNAPCFRILFDRARAARACGDVFCKIHELLAVGNVFSSYPNDGPWLIAVHCRSALAQGPPRRAPPSCRACPGHPRGAATKNGFGPRANCLSLAGVSRAKMAGTSPAMTCGGGSRLPSKRPETTGRRHRDGERRRSPPALGAVADRLDVVAVGVDDEGGVVVRRIVAGARRAVVLRSGLEGCGVEGAHRGLVRARERQMDAGARLARQADPEDRRFAPESGAVVKGHELLDSERGEGLLVKSGQDVELAGAEGDVVDHGSGPFVVDDVRLLSWLGAGEPFDVFVAGAAVVDGAAAGQTDEIADTARVRDQAAEFAIGYFLPLDGADSFLDANG